MGVSNFVGNTLVVGGSLPRRDLFKVLCSVRLGLAHIITDAECQQCKPPWEVARS